MNRDVAMQTRCVHCLHEQYGPNVFAVSFGEATCAWCGRASKEMTHTEYRAALARQEPPE